MMAAFRKGLNQAGYVAGQSVAIEYRWAENQYDRWPASAGELLRRQVTVFFSGGASTGSLAAMAATSTIPIVFASGADVTEIGLVATLSRPGGNVTGISFLFAALGQKQLEFLHELVPTATVAVLMNPRIPTTDAPCKDVQATAWALGLKVLAVHASTDHDLSLVFASLGHLRAGGLLINDAFLNSRGNQLVGLAARHSIPAIYPWRKAVVADGLASYATSITYAYRLAGIFTGRILNGEKPSDLPVQQSVLVELVINLKTAKDLGLTMPRTLLARADEVNRMKRQDFMKLITGSPLPGRLSPAQSAPTIASDSAI